MSYEADDEAKRWAERNRVLETRLSRIAEIARGQNDSVIDTEFDRVVIESPLAGDTRGNFRFLLWCCRAVYEIDNLQPIASHLLSPWFMDDAVPAEREDGIRNPWAWSQDVSHWFFLDLGKSNGMAASLALCEQRGILNREYYLEQYAPRMFEAFERGEWPSHTQGFELRTELR